MGEGPVWLGYQHNKAKGKPVKSTAIALCFTQLLLMLHGVLTRGVPLGDIRSWLYMAVFFTTPVICLRFLAAAISQKPSKEASFINTDRRSGNATLNDPNANGSPKSQAENATPKQLALKVYLERQTEEREKAAKQQALEEYAKSYGRQKAIRQRSLEEEAAKKQAIEEATRQRVLEKEKRQALKASREESTLRLAHKALRHKLRKAAEE